MSNENHSGGSPAEIHLAITDPTTPPGTPPRAAQEKYSREILDRWDEIRRSNAWVYVDGEGEIVASADDAETLLHWDINTFVLPEDSESPDDPPPVGAWSVGNPDELPESGVKAWFSPESGHLMLTHRRYGTIDVSTTDVVEGTAPFWCADCDETFAPDGTPDTDSGLPCPDCGGDNTGKAFPIDDRSTDWVRKFVGTGLTVPLHTTLPEESEE